MVSDGRAEDGTQPRLLDVAGYWLTLIGVYFLVGVLFFYSGKGKLFDGHGAPAAIEKQFQGTFVATFPGVDALWAILAVLEFAIAVILAISLVTGEFLPHRSKTILLVGLSLALFVFACLSFGETVTGQNSGTASLFSYFGSTAIIILLVRMLPPHGPRAWLSARLN